MLVLDTSGSMQGQPIDHLNQGLSAFEKQLKHNALAVRRVEVGVITFGAGGVQQVQPFIQARHFVAPTLAADGVTPMGEAVTMALQALRTRKNEYRTMGLPYTAVASCSPTARQATPVGRPSPPRRDRRNSRRG